MSDPVNPNHYKSDTIECIDAMKACSTPEEFRGHLKLTVMKYLWREDKKGEGDKARVENLEKAAWYLDRLVNDLRGDVFVPNLKDGLSAEALEKWEQYEGLLKRDKDCIRPVVVGHGDVIPPHTINAADQGWRFAGVDYEQPEETLGKLVDVEFGSGGKYDRLVADELDWLLPDGDGGRVVLYRVVK